MKLKGQTIALSRILVFIVMLGGYLACEMLEALYPTGLFFLKLVSVTYAFVLAYNRICEAPTADPPAKPTPTAAQTPEESQREDPGPGGPYRTPPAEKNAAAPKPSQKSNPDEALEQLREASAEFQATVGGDIDIINTALQNIGKVVPEAFTNEEIGPFELAEDTTVRIRINGRWSTMYVKDTERRLGKEFLDISRNGNHLFRERRIIAENIDLVYSHVSRYVLEAAAAQPPDHQ